jgi:hypothetical protein
LSVASGKASVPKLDVEVPAQDESRASWQSIVGLRIAKVKRARHLGRDLALTRRALVEQR